MRGVRPPAPGVAAGRGNVAPSRRWPAPHLDLAGLDTPLHAAVGVSLRVEQRHAQPLAAEGQPHLALRGGWVGAAQRVLVSAQTRLSSARKQGTSWGGLRWAAATTAAAAAAARAAWAAALQASAAAGECWGRTSSVSMSGAARALKPCLSASALSEVASTFSLASLPGVQGKGGVQGVRASQRRGGRWAGRKAAGPAAPGGGPGHVGVGAHGWSVPCRLAGGAAAGAAQVPPHP
jgi:hypothetical protein